MMKKLKLLIVALFILLSMYNSYGQSNYAVSFNYLSQNSTASPRPILIKIYTDWCTVCKIQDRQIAKDAALQNILATDYYYLELNAEARLPITFNTKEYKFIPHGTSGGIHALAAELDNSGAYPAWVLLSPDYKVLSRYNGLIKSKELKALLMRQD